MTPPSVRLTGNGLVLREWVDADLPAMRELFDDPDVAYRTPLRSPFGSDAAREYLDAAYQGWARAERLHLAVTLDGGRPLGEVMLNVTRGSLGYAIGAAHRGQGLARRATRLLVDHAHQVLGIPRLLLEIEADHTASIAVARALGFRPGPGGPEIVPGKGRSVVLHPWIHEETGVSRAGCG